MRNVESRLAMVPRANISRSKFDMTPFRHLTTMNAGKLVPIFVQECLPAGTYSLTVKDLIRMSTPIHPVMDDCYLDTYFFFVPNRLVWRNWEEFMGENKNGYWTKNQQQFVVPQIVINSPDGVVKGSILDYMGIPTNVGSDILNNHQFSINALPVRAYNLIWNEWFRDQNTMSPVYISDTEDDEEYSRPNGDWFDTAPYGGDLLPVSKFHDYFTSALPEPQRGPDVNIPLAGDMVPIVTGSDRHDISPYPLTWSDVQGSEPFEVSGSLGISIGNTVVNTNGGVGSQLVTPDNLYGDLSQAVSATINELRMAVALQTFYEASARYGGRYTELLRGHFGVISPDSRLQRPEYIGGKRVKINMQQVLQTSSTDETSPQGNTSGFSLTADIDKSFTYSCVEHGFIIGVCCIRTRQTYQYGLNRMWSRRDMIDYYFPEFAHIGEQPLLNKELYATGTDTDDEVFGYQEAWAEYRQNHSYITGAYRSNYAQTLDSWHYAEKLDSLPTLSAEFMSQSTQVIDRTLAVTSEVEDQFLCDFEFNMTCVLPMPMYSVPGFGLRF